MEVKQLVAACHCMGPHQIRNSAARARKPEQEILQALKHGIPSLRHRRHEDLLAHGLMLASVVCELPATGNGRLVDLLEKDGQTCT